jgi:hypothetical protein
VRCLLRCGLFGYCGKGEGGCEKWQEGDMSWKDYIGAGSGLKGGTADKADRPSALLE